MSMMEGRQQSRWKWMSEMILMGGAIEYKLSKDSSQDVKEKRWQEQWQGGSGRVESCGSQASRWWLLDIQEMLGNKMIK